MEDKKDNLHVNEIDLLSFVQFVWHDRKFIIKTFIASIVLGLFIAFSIKDEYTATCDLLVEGQSDANGFSGLSGLAGLAGINLANTTSNRLTPELYPKIVNSTPFIQKVAYQPIFFESLDSSISSIQYFEKYDKHTFLSLVKKYTIGLPSMIKELLQAPKKSQPLDIDKISRITKEEWNLIKSFNERLTIFLEPKSGIIQIGAEMPDPVAAAMLTSLVVEQLTLKVSQYKTDKSKSNLEFVRQRLDEAKSKYVNKQEEFAKFSNNNRNLSNALGKAENQRIQNELNILFEVYKGLATQYQQLEIKVKEETPIFTVLEPVIVPLEKSSTTKKMALAIAMLLGIVVAIGISILKKIIIDIKK